MEDIYERAARKSNALRRANGWSIDEMERRIKSGQIKIVMGSDGCYDLVVDNSSSAAGDAIVARMRQQEPREPERKPGVTVVDGIEIPDGSPFWLYIPSWIIMLTFPLWIIPYLIYLIVRPLAPGYETMHDKMVRLGIEEDTDDWTYAERERMQWTLGTGRYADDYR